MWALPLPRTNPGNRSKYVRRNGPYTLVMNAGGLRTLAQADMDMDSFMEVGIWTLAVVPFFIAGMLAALKCGELASMLVTGGGAGGSGLMGMVSTAGMVAASGGTAAAAKAGGGIK